MGVDQMHLAQYRDQWRVSVNTALNVKFWQSQEDSVTSVDVRGSPVVTRLFPLSIRATQSKNLTTPLPGMLCQDHQNMFTTSDHLI